MSVKHGWKELFVSDLIKANHAETKTGPFGTQLKASSYVESGTPVINVRNIGFGNIRPDKLEFIGPDTVKRLSTHLLLEDDIVFGRKGAVERHAFIRPEQRHWFQGSDCLRLRFNANDLVLPRFVSYFLLTEEHKSWMMNQCSHGATMASLNQDIISRIPLRLPSLPTQRKIASILSAYDDLIENNSRRIAILEEMAQAIYREWFVNFRFPGHENVKLVQSTLGMIPEGWRIVELGDSLEIRRGKNITRKNVTLGSVPVVAGGIHPSCYHNESNTGSPVITVSASGANAGHVSLYHKPVWASDCSFIDPVVSPHVYYLYSLFQDRRIEITGLQRGAAQPHVYPQDLMRLNVLDVTRELVNKFENDMTPNFRLIGNLLQRNDNLRTTRDLLLPKLISGQLDVEDIDIETGEPLVEAEA